MTVPMIVLAVGSVVAGASSHRRPFLDWLEPVTGHADGDSPISAADRHRCATHGRARLSASASPGACTAAGGPGRPARGSLLTRAARARPLQ